MKGKPSLKTFQRFMPSMIQHLLDTGSQVLLYFMIPKTKDRPPLFPVRPVDLPVSLDVALYFWQPKIPVGLDGMLFFMPIISMPKSTIDKNNELVFDKDDIRFPQKPPGTPSVPKSGMPDRLFEYYFGLRIGRPNPAHHARSIRRGIKAVFLAKPGDLYGTFVIFLLCFSHCWLLNKNFKDPVSNRSGLRSHQPLC